MMLELTQLLQPDTFAFSGIYTCFWAPTCSYPIIPWVPSPDWLQSHPFPCLLCWLLYSVLQDVPLAPLQWSGLRAYGASCSCLTFSSGEAFPTALFEVFCWLVVWVLLFLRLVGLVCSFGVSFCFLPAVFTSLEYKKCGLLSFVHQKPSHHFLLWMFLHISENLRLSTL